MKKKEKDGKDKSLQTALEPKMRHKEILASNKFQKGKDASEKGRRGGINSGIARRAKRDARESVKYMLGLAAKGQIDESLEKLGFPKEERTNLAAVNAKLLQMALQGDIEAYKTLMKIGGYEPEENRKERESLSSDARRDIELQAKMKALGGEIEGSRVSVDMKGEDNDSDVIIYLPEIDKIDTNKTDTEEAEEK